MKLLFISEVQWLSQASRKHHLIRRFPDDWEVLFVSPVNAGARENSFIVRRDRTRPRLRYLSLPLPKPDSRFALVRSAHGLLSLNARMLLPLVSRLEHPDVVVCSYIWASAAVRAIRGSGTPIVYDCNDYHPHDYPLRRRQAEEAFRDLVDAVDEVVAPLSYLRDQCGRGVVIGNGTDLSLFHRRLDAPRPPLLAEGPVGHRSELVVFVGSVDGKMDTGIVGKLLEQMAGSGRDVGLLFLGRIFDEVVGDVKRLSGAFPDRVHFAGRVPYEELPEYLSHCSVGVMPYVLNPRLRAANPSKLYMYAAMDLDIVSTPFSENVLDHGELVSVATDPTEFARAVLDALDDESRRGKVRAAIAEPNDWNERAAEFVRLLETLEREE